MAEARAWTFADASGAALWARRLLYTDAALSAAAVALALARGLDPWSAGQADLMLGIGQLGVYLVGAILALRWLYLANANVRSLGATDLMGSPGLAVGWFFIPLANLVMPYLTVRDMWKASADPRDWQAASAPAAIVLWWCCWLAAGVTGMIALRLQIEFAEEAGEAMEIVSLVSNLVSIPAVLLFAWIIGRIQAMQEKARLIVALA